MGLGLLQFGSVGLKPSETESQEERVRQRQEKSRLLLLKPEPFASGATNRVAGQSQLVAVAQFEPRTALPPKKVKQTKTTLRHRETCGGKKEEGEKTRLTINNVSSLSLCARIGRGPGSGREVGI